MSNAAGPGVQPYPLLVTYYFIGPSFVVPQLPQHRLRVLAQRRRGGADAPRRAVEHVGTAEHGHAAEDFALDLGPQAALAQHGVVEEVRGSIERGEHRLGAARLRPDLRTRAAQHPGVDDRVRLFLRRRVEYPGRVLPLGVAQGVVADHLDEALPVVAEGGRHLDVAVRHRI